MGHFYQSHNCKTRYITMFVSLLEHTSSELSDQLMLNHSTRLCFVFHAMQVLCPQYIHIYITTHLFSKSFLSVIFNKDQSSFLLALAKAIARPKRCWKDFIRRIRQLKNVLKAHSSMINAKGEASSSKVSLMKKAYKRCGVEGPTLYTKIL